jgi:hypothetical protein
MTEDRRPGLNGTGMRDRTWIGFAGMIAVVLAGLGTTTCDVPGSWIETCDEVSDCDPSAGLICNDGICTCPHADEAYCMGECRPIAECLPDGGGSGGGGGTGGSGLNGQCNAAADCPQPGDPHCGEATCENGVCGLELRPFSALSSQVRGDCKELWCDGAGNLIEIKEASDTYNDGLQCTLDVCDMGEAKAKPHANAITCPETG